MFDSFFKSKKKINKWLIFLCTLIIGGAICSFRLFEGKFSEQSWHDWALDSLFVAAILGFIVLKWLKKKGKVN